MANIRIDRLNIHLKGVSQQSAQEVVSGLGTKIMQELSNREVYQQNGKSAQINEIIVDPIKFYDKRSSITLQREIANKIVDSIEKVKANQNPKL